VKTEIIRLEKATEAKRGRQFQQAEQLAEQLPLRAGESYSKGRRADAFEAIAREKVELGDFNGADEDLAKMKRFAVSENPSTYLGVKQILKAYETKNDAADVERLRQKLALLSAEVRLGWDEKNPGRETVVNAWSDAANQLNLVYPVRDLPAYLSEDLKKSPEDAPAGVAQAAGALGAGLIRIHALEKIYH
jgi:hypothetical protein